MLILKHPTLNFSLNLCCLDILPYVLPYTNSKPYTNIIQPYKPPKFPNLIRSNLSSLKPLTPLTTTIRTIVETTTNEETTTTLPTPPPYVQNVPNSLVF